MKKQTHLRLPLVFTTMVVVVMAFNFGYDPGLGWFSYAQEPDQVKEQIFNEAREAFERARAKDVPLLSPNNFAKANEFYQKALEDYQKGERLEKIQENLKRAMEHIDAAFESAKLSRVVLERMLRLREETLNLEFLKYRAGVTRPHYFKGKLLTEADFRDEQSYHIPKAEQKFRESAMKIEEGDVRSARSIARKAEEEYRWSAIEALKKIVLADAKKKLKDAKRTIPKESFRKAKAELDETKNFIEAQKGVEFAIGEFFAEVDARIQQTLTLAGIVVEAAELPDLVIEEFAFSPERPHVGEDVVIHAVVRNVGNLSAERTLILFLTQEERGISRATIDYLEPGQVEEVNITTTVQEPGDWRITVRVDPENRIEESDERNNEASRVLVVEERLEPTKPREAKELIVHYTEGKILEPQPRCAPDPRLPLNPAKTPKQWDEMFSMKYAGIFEIDPRKEKDFPIELTKPSLIFIKVYSYGDEKGRLSAELYQEGREQPVWATEAVMLRESIGFINDQVEITADMIAAGTSWTIKLLNSANQAVSTEVWIGLASPLE